MVQSFLLYKTLVSGIGAVVKVVDSHPCGWGSIPNKTCSFFIVSLSKGLSLCFMCSDQHVKYRMRRGFLLASRLLLHYHVKIINTHMYIHTFHNFQSMIKVLILTITYNNFWCVLELFLTIIQSSNLAFAALYFKRKPVSIHAVCGLLILLSVFYVRAWL